MLFTNVPLISAQETTKKVEEVSSLEPYVWLRQQKSWTMPRSLLGMAIAYSLNPWEKLSAFLKNGILEIDNKTRPSLHREV
ncbi:transposase and inactivated derivative [Paenibacillus popilliae ATCC 14706]|uniref:Transposase and inactivated derivative n=1 Tax=Paenibacillus popilliae ATCC 14706 TaxID=1212764 RepID=M9LAL8_PAEPP|nr:transposase and inactivated derivative [Paenibacillus popilliae ATCC 14706]